MSTGMELLDSPMVMVQYGLALAVPAVLAAIMNLGCGKKRDQPPRPGAQKTLSKSAKPAGASSKSKRASKSSSASAKSGKSSKKDKSGKSKKSASKDKSGKASKKSSKKDKSSKSSKSKKSKRDLKSKTDAAAAAAGTASQRSDAAKQPTSAATREAEKRAAAKQTAVALANDNSAKSAPTQVASASLKQPPSGGALDGNANVAVATGAGGTTALVAIGGDSTRELKMEPAELRWSSAGGMQKISLINQSAERQAIKVKCSDNNVYRVNPVYAIVEPGQTLNVDVMRQNGSNKVDKIVFVTARAGLEENPKNAFKPGAPASMMVLPLLATSAAAAHNQPALAV